MDPYLWPGPDGAVSTVRLEMMREGLMECEARITVEAALLDPQARTTLGEARATAWEAMLTERIGWLRQAGGWPETTGGISGEQIYISSDWQNRNAALFAAAAEVNRLLGQADPSRTALTRRLKTGQHLACLCVPYADRRSSLSENERSTRSTSYIRGEGR
jgi:hypothetical protein